MKYESLCKIQGVTDSKRELLLTTRMFLTGKIHVLSRFRIIVNLQSKACFTANDACPKQMATQLCWTTMSKDNFVGSLSGDDI